jgi:hypothetical protein
MASTPIYPQSQDNRSSKFSAGASVAFIGGIERVHMPMPPANQGLHPSMEEHSFPWADVKLLISMVVRAGRRKNAEFEIATTVYFYNIYINIISRILLIF